MFIGSDSTTLNIDHKLIEATIIDKKVIILIYSVGLVCGVKVISIEHVIITTNAHIAGKQ